MPDKRYTLHVISHTHWDREWYQEFQGFRQRLVFQMDAMLDLMERREDFRYFHLDGQTVCLEDYLQIRPENRERLTKLMREGRVLVGPWFAMPDELLLSGESLVRNLMLGHRICAEFGVDPMPIGYVSDIFGHCSQFPQIVRGFGMDTVFLHRGTSNADDASEMLWEGADGSEVLVIKAYPHTGYQDFLTYRNADDATLLDYERKKHAYAATNVLYALDGNDHEPARLSTLEVMDRWTSVFKDTQCIHSSMPAYLAELKAALGDLSKAGLIKLKGELRTTKKLGLYGELMQGTASSRVYLKQRNDELEYLLPRCAESLHAWSLALGGDSQKPFLDLAWKYLLTNHPHDSIVGCSTDQVHRDMIYRFDQARCIAANSIGESLHAIGDRLDTASLGESELVVTAYNPSSVDLGPVVEFPFEIFSGTISDKRREGLEPVLIDESGELGYFEPFAINGSAWPTPQVKKTYGDDASFARVANAWHSHHRFHAGVVGEIPASGYKSWRIKFVPAEQAKVALPEGIRAVSVDPATNTIENEFLKLRIGSDGLFDLLDKPTGASYTGLHELENCGDSGQGWDHFYPEHDTVIKGAKGPATVKVEAKGSLLAVAEISYAMEVPADIDRPEERVAMPVTIRLELRAGSRRVDIRTTITNTARRHRVRALLPTRLAASTWFADSAFDLVERPIQLPDTTGWEETAREETPIKNFAAVQGKKAGLAIIAKGVQEACVQDNPDRTLALTLFRGFMQYIGGGYTTDSLMLGDITLEYALAPFTAQGDAPVHLFDEVERYKLKPISLTFPAHPGDLPPSGRFLELPKGLVVSTVKASEEPGSLIVRVYNPSSSEITGSMALHKPITRAWRCDMLERDVAALEIEGGRARVAVKAKEAATLRLE